MYMCIGVHVRLRPAPHPLAAPGPQLHGAGAEPGVAAHRRLRPEEPRAEHVRGLGHAELLLLRRAAARALQRLHGREPLRDSRRRALPEAGRGGGQPRRRPARPVEPLEPRAAALHGPLHAQGCTYRDRSIDIRYTY